MSTTQPLTLLIGPGVSDETAQRWETAGHKIYRFLPELLGMKEDEIDGFVSEKAWRANDEMLKSTEGMMFKAMRAEKRARTPKPEKKARKPRKKKGVTDETHVHV